MMDCANAATLADLGLPSSHLRRVPILLRKLDTLSNGHTMLKQRRLNVKAFNRRYVNVYSLGR